MSYIIYTKTVPDPEDSSNEITIYTAKPPEGIREIKYPIGYFTTEEAAIEAYNNALRTPTGPAFTDSSDAEPEI